MKRFSAILIILVLLFLSSCNINKNNSSSNINLTEKSTSMTRIAILDYETEKTVKEFDTTDNKSITISNMINYTKPTKDKINDVPTYILHLIDLGDSQYDAWFNIYLNKKVYVQPISDKMKYSKKMNISNEIRVSKKVSLKEFLSLLDN